MNSIKESNVKEVLSDYEVVEQREPLQKEELNKQFKSIWRKSQWFVVGILLALIAIVGGYVFSPGIKPSKETDRIKNINQIKISPTVILQQPISGILDLQQDKDTINDGEIIFVKDGKVYMLNTTSMNVYNFSIVGLQNVSDISFSPDASIFIANVEESILVYDIKQKKILAKIPMDLETVGPSPRVERGHISPNNQYFIVTTSCCPGDVGRTIFTINGKKLKNLSGGITLWSPDGSSVVMSRGDFELYPLPFGPPPGNSSIYLETIIGNTVTEKLLLKGSYQISVAPIKWIDNTTLLYGKDTYREPFPQTPDAIDINNEQVQNYWIDVFENPSPSYGKISLANGANENVLDQEEIDYRLVGTSPNKRWNLRLEYENGENIFYITNSSGNKKIKLIGVQEAVWNPAIL